MHTRRLLLALVLVACRSTPPARPPDATAQAATVAARLPRAANDLSARFFTAYEQVQKGDAAAGLALLQTLDAAGWNVPLDPRDWPGLAEDPAFVAVSQRIAARAPKTPHAPVAFTVSETGLIPEGITHDPVTGALYVGSIRQRKIVRIAADGSTTDFVASATHGLLSPLGMKIDTARKLLWVGSMTSKGMVRYEAAEGERAALFAFDLASGALRQSVFAPPGEHLLNDLALAGDGTVYVTDSTAGAVWKLTPGAEELTPVVGGGFVYSNGIVLLPAANALVVCDALGLTRVPLDGTALKAIEGPAGTPLGGIDGLSVDASGALVAVQNGLGSPRVIRIQLDAQATRATAVEVLEANNPAWHIPTTGTVVGNTLLYVGNAHLDGLSEQGLTAEAAAAPTRVFRLPLP